MRQVPASYLILGDGRVARHLWHYFDLEALPYLSWSRRKDSLEKLDQLIAQSTHVLLALSDPAISAFVDTHPAIKTKVAVHFSGTLNLDAVAGAHPLMTFSRDLYDLETYRQIPFVLDRGTIGEILPGLKNPSYQIAPEKKTLYHALCVLSGNFTTLLWEKTAKDFSEKLGLPKEVLTPYMNRIVANLAQAKVNESVLTGPLVRGDEATIQKHLNVLEGDPFAEVYRAFVHAYERNQR